ncbi:MAG: RIP metalloprotease RseP, partial [Dysgonamonadaceae bacterium]
FRSKPAWQRLLVMIAGVLFNILLAFIIYAMVLFTWDDTYLPLRNVHMGMEFSEVAHKVGFQDGDILLKADDKELERFGVSTLLDIVNARQVTVLRDGQEVVIPIPENFMNELMAAKEGFATYRFPTVVAEVQEGSGAAKAGLRSGDSLVAINGVPTPTFIDFKRELEKNKNREITIEFYRNGILNTTVAQVDSTGLLGFYPKSPMQIYQPVTISYNFFEAFPAGIKMGIQTLKDYVNQFKYVFTKEGVSSLGGFGTIGSLFPPVWDWHAFWMMTAFLSVILAFMNILPIPGLDGGHVLFLLCEVISGKKPSEKFLEYAQIAGMIFLLALVLYANGMDIIRAIFK